MTLALSCDQLCPITADRMALMISTLMISVAPSVPPVSAHQCHLSVPISAHQCHISVPTSAHQCHISVPI
ncbi:unnamed protein product [Staurois parvus]|uniref:Uncharacterized protein n=1 Tax=Staurois parvus TaxID=386267 RepID=A0ABN9DPZ7_9NEOB|nr:unnamed protein product [Staurois parvus]